MSLKQPEPAERCVLQLNRFERCEDGATLGELLIPEERMGGQWVLHKLATIERRWANNERSVSCIPDGDYPLHRIYHGRFFARYKKAFGHTAVWEICDVPDRSAILIHIANFENDLKGCLGLGWPVRGRKAKEKRTYESAKAYRRFYELMDKLAARQAGLSLRVRTAGDRPCAVA